MPLKQIIAFFFLLLGGFFGLLFGWQVGALATGYYFSQIVMIWTGIGMVISTIIALSTME